MLTTIIVLSFLVFFHELGHFLAARFFGIKVEVFSIGFGNKIYSKVFNGTEYCLSLIPLGGYVKMKGQEDLDPLAKNSDSDSYNSKSPFARLCVLFAGPFGNFLIAFFIFYFLALFGMKTLSPVIGNVMKESPAYKSGLIANDRILEINGVVVDTWEEMSSIIQQSDSALQMVVDRDNKQKIILVNPQILDGETIFGEKIQKIMIGVSPKGDVKIISYSFIDSFYIAFSKTYEASKLIFMSIVKLIEGVLSPDNLGGIISIVQVTSEASEAGLYTLLSLTALISVNLGVLNLLPIPALDGGHMMFTTYELITKKVPSENVLYKMTIAGWITLGTLMIFGIYNDINRLISG